jgi:hypothetical protein
MANPADVTVHGTGSLDSDVAALLTSFNKLVVNLRVLTAKLDADAGVTDTNYAALVTDSAASGPTKVTTLIG